MFERFLQKLVAMVERESEKRVVATQLKHFSDVGAVLLDCADADEHFGGDFLT